MLVLDASFVLSSILPDEAGGDPAGLFDSYDEVIAPWLLWAEVRNSLLTLERRGRLSATFVDSALETLAEYHIALDQMPRSGAVLRLARRHALTAYDAVYLELALHRDADFATLDRTLAKAARAEGVRVVG